MAALLAVLLLACSPLAAQSPDPARDPLEQALAQGYAALQASDLLDAIQHFESAARMAPVRASIHNELAYTYLKTTNEQTAQDIFRYVLQLNPRDQQATLDLAFSYQRTGNIDQAAALFERVAAHGNETEQRTAEQALSVLPAPPEPPAEPAAETSPAREPLEDAYRALHDEDYDTAIVHFRKAVQEAPLLASLRKDLGYTYLKVGESEWAREMFTQAVELDPRDRRASLELAFLWYETGEQRRAFELLGSLREDSDVEVRETARKALEGIDREWSEGIARWKKVVEDDPFNRSAQLELAGLYEKHGQPAKAVDHYLAAWIVPSDQPRDEILLKLARSRDAAGDPEAAVGAWLLASRSKDTRIAEAAKEKLPARYPYASEFRRALELHYEDAELRRDLAYLQLEVGNTEEARKEFEIIVRQKPDDLLSASQLAFLYLERRNEEAAVRLLEKARQSPDDGVAERAQETLRHINEAKAKPHRDLGEKSLRASYLKDALREFLRAYEINPGDHTVALKLGVVHNLLRQDREAFKWFRIASASSDSAIAEQARQSYENLEPQFRRVTTTLWTFPFVSSRYKNTFLYSQLKTEFRLGRLPLRPYLSLRFIGDAQQHPAEVVPQFLSESSLIAGFGMRTPTRHGVTVWGEAGEAFNYQGRRPRGVPRAGPDYRGGINFVRATGPTLANRWSGKFIETNVDAVYVSRFDDDVVGYWQVRPGYRPAPRGGFNAKVYFNLNLTADTKRQYWANYAEFGPGIRLRVPGVSPPMDLSVNVVRGVHLANRFNPRGPNYWDVRVGLWYSFAM